MKLSDACAFVWLCFCLMGALLLDTRSYTKFLGCPWLDDFCARYHVYMHVPVCPSAHASWYYLVLLVLLLMHDIITWPKCDLSIFYRQKKHNGWKCNTNWMQTQKRKIVTQKKNSGQSSLSWSWCQHSKPLFLQIVCMLAFLCICCLAFP